eukprot:3392759-Pleurochrysis_carterae.AAC.1
MPTPIVSDGREPLPPDLTGVEAQKVSPDHHWRVKCNSQWRPTSLTLCPPDLPGSDSSTR